MINYGNISCMCNPKKLYLIWRWIIRFRYWFQQFQQSLIQDSTDFWVSINFEEACGKVDCIFITLNKIRNWTLYYKLITSNSLSLSLIVIREALQSLLIIHSPISVWYNYFCLFISLSTLWLEVRQGGGNMLCFAPLLAVQFCTTCHLYWSISGQSLKKQVISFRNIWQFRVWYKI